MKINKYVKADEALLSELGAFVRQCEEIDGFKTVIDLDASLNAYPDMPSIFTYEEGGLRAVISVFAPMKDEVEVSALVHPDIRGKGVFRALIKEALAECSRFGYGKGLFICVSESGKNIMEHWNLGIDHVELEMSYDVNESIKAPEQGPLEIRRALESDVDGLAYVGAAAFGMDAVSEREFIKNALTSNNREQYIAILNGHAAGMCAVMESDGKLMIYGLGVHPDQRRKGVAKAMLKYVESEAAARGMARLGLYVDEDNPAAKALYKEFGFEYKGRTEYYSFTFDAFM